MNTDPARFMPSTKNSTTVRPLAQVLPLLRDAAERMTAAGLDRPTRIRTFRGLYYGTAHCLDFEKRHSSVRNLGFNLYLQNWPPRDPSRILGAALVRSLKEASEVGHAGRTLDLGHIFVGLEARSSFFVRRLRIPAHGGTGLELSTWLGDLAGAAGLLAIQRMEAPSTRAIELLFSAHTYDLSANLEGDLAGYLVGRIRQKGATVTPIDQRSFITVAQAIQEYVGAGDSASDWRQRHRVFAQMIGAKVGQDGIANREQLLRDIQTRTEAFGAFYLIYRMRQLGTYSQAALVCAGRYLSGASSELAAIFVDMLHQGILDRKADVRQVYDPSPKPAGEVPFIFRILNFRN